MVEERSLGRRRYTERSAGGMGSENAGISNERKEKILPAEYPRIPGQ